MGEEIELTEEEISRRNWLNEGNSLIQRIYDLELRISSITYSIDLLDAHRTQVKRELNKIKNEYEEYNSKGV